MFDKTPSQSIIPFPYHSLDYNDNRNTVDLHPNIPRLYDFRLIEQSALYRHRFYCIMTYWLHKNIKFHPTYPFSFTTTIPTTTKVTSKLLKTGEFPTTTLPQPPLQTTAIEEEDCGVTIPLNFSKALRSSSIQEMHQLLRSCMELRVVENKILVNNEPKPEADDIVGTSSAKDILKG
ncbi:MAG: hypothetical protein AAFY21_20565 [Cyanobacteria bacterium J06641_2]